MDTGLNVFLCAQWFHVGMMSAKWRGFCLGSGQTLGMTRSMLFSIKRETVYTTHSGVSVYILKSGLHHKRAVWEYRLDFVRGMYTSHDVLISHSWKIITEYMHHILE